VNKYEFVFEGEEEKFVNELEQKVSIEDSQKNGNSLKMKVKLSESFSSNDLLTIIMKHGSIHSFNEILPSMNDIFIHMVESQK